MKPPSGQLWRVTNLRTGASTVVFVANGYQQGSTSRAGWPRNRAIAIAIEDGRIRTAGDAGSYDAVPERG